MHAAVVLGSGSDRTFPGASSGRASRTSAAWLAAVTTRTRSAGTSPRSRSKVSAIRGRSPWIGRNCLGRAARLAGQKRVPEPPAMMIANGARRCMGSGPVRRAAERLARPERLEALAQGSKAGERQRAGLIAGRAPEHLQERVADDHLRAIHVSAHGDSPEAVVERVEDTAEGAQPIQESVAHLEVVAHAPIEVEPPVADEVQDLALDPQVRREDDALADLEQRPQPVEGRLAEPELGVELPHHRDRPELAVLHAQPAVPRELQDVARRAVQLQPDVELALVGDARLEYSAQEPLGAHVLEPQGQVEGVRLRQVDPQRLARARTDSTEGLEASSLELSRQVVDRQASVDV